MKKDARVEDFQNLARQKGTKKVLMSDVVGMPDQQDEEFIQKLIQMHEKMTGGALRKVLDYGRREFEAGKYGNLRNDVALVNKGSNMTYDFELPGSFVFLVEKYYPTMFRDVEHYRWFKRKLPGLMIRPNKKRINSK